MNLNYEQLKTLAHNFKQLDMPATDIIDYVDSLSGDVFIGSYSDLAKSMGKDTANTRKALLRLEKLGVVVVDRPAWSSTRTKMLRCKLVPGWILVFLGEINES